MYEIGQPEIDAVAAVLRSGQLFRYRGGEGGEVDTLEKQMIAMLGCRHSLAVTSGTAAQASDTPLTPSPSADTVGDCDCGCYTSFLFSSAQDRQRVAARALELDPACGMHSPIDSGLHVYTNWSVLLEQQGGHHPAMNPFTMKANQGCRLKTTADSCPRSLELLARTGALTVDIRWTQEQCESMARTLCRAAKDVL